MLTADEHVAVLYDERNRFKDGSVCAYLMGLLHEFIDNNRRISERKSRSDRPPANDPLHIALPRHHWKLRKVPRHHQRRGLGERRIAIDRRDATVCRRQFADAITSTAIPWN